MQTITIKNLIDINPNLLDVEEDKKVFEYYKKYTKNGTDFRILDRNETVRKPIELLVKELNEKLAKSKKKETKTTATKPKTTQKKETAKKTTATKRKTMQKKESKELDEKIKEILLKLRVWKNMFKDISLKQIINIEKEKDIHIDKIKHIIEIRNSRTKNGIAKAIFDYLSDLLNYHNLYIVKYQNEKYYDDFYCKIVNIILNSKIGNDSKSNAFKVLQKEIANKNGIYKRAKFKKGDKVIYIGDEYIIAEVYKPFCTFGNEFSYNLKNKDKIIENIEEHFLEKQTSKKKSTRKSTSTKKTKPNAKPVNSVDLQLSILKSFYLLLDKEVPNTRLLTLYRKIEKAALEKKIRKTDKHAKLIEKISEIIAKEYNKGKDYVKVSISEKEKQNIKELAYSQKQRDSIRLLKRFVYLIGKETKDKVERLLLAIERAKIRKTDPYYEQIELATDKLNEYLKTRREIEMTEAELRGLSGIVEVPEKKKVKTKNLTKESTSQGLSGTGIMSSLDLKKVEFDNYEFTEHWKDLVGNPSKPFQIMIYGRPGSGKSTFTIQFAKYLAGKQNLKVLYWAKEEGPSQTFKEKLERLNAFDNNLYITERKPDSLHNFDVLIIDSVNDAGLTVEEIEKIEKTIPNLSLVMIFQTTKDGMFRGQNTWEHLVQTVIEVKNGIATTGKNRFGARGSYRIFDDDFYPDLNDDEDEEDDFDDEEF